MRMDAPRGFEPRPRGPKPRVLPLDYGAKGRGRSGPPLLSHLPALPVGQQTTRSAGIRTRTLATGLLALALAACQSAPVKVETVEVKVPVAVRPIKAADVPTVPKPLGPRPQSLSAAADVLLSRWCAAVAYMLKADPLLRVSAGAPQAALGRYPECEGH